MSRRSAELRPQLAQAQQDLAHALKEACGMDLKKASTGDLIHIDELLATASDSAKTAISVRRRLRKDGASPTSSGSTQSVTGTPAIDQPRRVFDDAEAVRWTTFAVRPSTSTSDRTRLPGPFLTGWLTFDSGTETRRLTPIPDGWADLTDDQLRRLCQQAKTSPRRGRSGQS